MSAVSLYLEISDSGANREAMIEEEDARQNAQMEVRTAARSYESAVKKVESAKARSDLAKEVLAITESEYSAGTGSSLDVTDARRQSNEAEINLAARTFEAQLALLQLFCASGEDIRTL